MFALMDFISLLGTLYDRINEQNTEIQLRMFIFKNKKHQAAVWVAVALEHVNIQTPFC